jgi:hypothetical protein
LAIADWKTARCGQAPEAKSAKRSQFGPGRRHAAEVTMRNEPNLARPGAGAAGQMRKTNPIWAGAGGGRKELCGTNPIGPGRGRVSEGKCAKRTQFGGRNPPRLRIADFGLKDGGRKQQANGSGQVPEDDRVSRRVGQEPGVRNAPVMVNDIDGRWRRAALPCQSSIIHHQSQGVSFGSGRG